MIGFDILIAENIAFFVIEIRIVHQLVECRMSFIVFSALDFDGNHEIFQFDQKVDFTAYLIAVVV